ncbi:MAG: AAA family ATPase, partial [Deltaproteobacteria bacterium]|nr:AAA family ATPase [Deltaproteobacteria bacterium]
MYLKRIEIAGFKSFTERTVVPFSKGISAVVGPNGCGKSNIIDAIRWVMGEQSPKLLRARNMEDLLFNGSKGKPPAALAEVALTLARDTERGQAEISVTRRLYRAGDSEYLINRSPVRLKDVVRFFIEAGMGTRAYAIIEQEKVGRLVDARPEERRLLLDEAAGITRYKEQKKETERKLEAASRNLETVSLMMAESSRRLASVSRQAAKAARHMTIRDELRLLELTLAAKGYLDLARARAESRARRGEAASLAASLIAKASEIEAAAEALKLEDGRAEMLLEDELSAYHALDGRFEKAKTELAHLRKSLEDAGASRKSAESELAGLDGERDRYEGDKARLGFVVAELSSDSEGLSTEAAGVRQELSLARSRHEEAAAAARKAADALAALKDSLARAGEGLAGAASLTEHLTGRRRALELEHNEMEHTLAAASDKASSRARFKKSLEDDLAALEGGLTRLREGASAARASSEAARAAAAAADSRASGLKARLETLESLEASFSWHPQEVGDLMSRKDMRDLGISGPVAGRLKVPKGAEEAAEAFLGPRLSWLVARDLPAALAALRAAREGRLGVYGFVCQDALEGRPLAEALLGGEITVPEPQASAGARISGTAGPQAPAGSQSPGKAAPGKAAAAERAAGAAAQAAGKAQVPGPADPEASDRALAALAAELRDGQVILARDGSFVSRAFVAGGARAKAGQGDGKGLLARLREKEEAGAALAAATEELSSLSAMALEARRAMEAAEGALSEKLAERSALASDLSRAEGRLVEAVSEEKGLRIRAGSLDSERKRVEAEITAAGEKHERFRREKEELEARLSEASESLEARVREREEAAGELEALQERENLASRAAASAAEKLEGARRELAGVEKFLGSLDSRKKSLAAEAARLKAQEADLAEKIRSLEEESLGLPEKLEEARERLKGLRSEKEAIKARLAEKEDELRLARKGREEGQESLNSLEKDILETEYRLARLKENLMKDWRAEFRATDEEGEGEKEGEGEGEKETQDSRNAQGEQESQDLQNGQDEHGIQGAQAVPPVEGPQAAPAGDGPQAAPAGD